MKKIFLFLLVMGALIPIGIAAEHWTPHDPALLPWKEAYTITDFKNKLYVSGLIRNPNIKQGGVWSSSDGKTWSLVYQANNNIVSNFAKTNDHLFGFTSDVIISSLTVTKSVLRTSDGVNWLFYDNGFFATVSKGWSDATAHNGFLYSADYGGNIYSSPADAGTAGWQLIESLSNQNPRIYFVNKGGELFIAENDSSAGANNSYFQHLKVDRTFEYWTSGGSNFIGPGFVELNSTLYGGGEALMANDVWNQYQQLNFLDGAGVDPYPFGIGTTLHVYSPESIIKSYSPSIGWTPESSDGALLCGSRNPNISPAGGVAYLGDNTFVLSCALMEYSVGLYGLKDASSYNPTITPGQKSVKSLGWTTQVNGSDVVTVIEVKNFGTAKAGKEILKLTLYKRGSDVPITELFPESNGDTWLTPDGFRLSVADGDKFDFDVDIADKVDEQVSLWLYIPTGKVGSQTQGIIPMSQNISGSIPQAILATQQTSVQGAIDGVIAFPQPASNSIHFRYTLNSPSSVTIQIINRSGQIVKELEDPNKSANLQAESVMDVSSLAPEVYFTLVKIVSDDGSTKRIKSKIIIEK